ncbi:hypothetical protein A7A76_21580 [Lysobacter enzymogenes]|uniref:hypothetical protein n=1 Tax=Lysobacter enzymogenes TaxID=69 RepID=UPI0019D2F0F3|nr:hypothetical protein [Lysobacter enzymogenes]MBN7137313.1 hypothetical protein [Lysobacter enzymogenes]
MKKRSLAALAAFVFGCAVITTATAAGDACQTCWMRYNKCVAVLDVQTCDYQVEMCLKSAGCPNPPW